MRLKLSAAIRKTSPHCLVKCRMCLLVLSLYNNNILFVFVARPSDFVLRNSSNEERKEEKRRIFSSIWNLAVNMAWWMAMADCGNWLGKPRPSRATRVRLVSEDGTAGKRRSRRRSIVRINVLYIISDESNLDVQRLPIAFAYRKRAAVGRSVIVTVHLLRESLMTRSITDLTGPPIHRARTRSASLSSDTDISRWFGNLIANVLHWRTDIHRPIIHQKN